MLKIVLIFIFSFNAHAQLSYGDGSDTCNWAVTDTKAGNIFNCDSVSIAGGVTITFSSTNFITIRSRGDVVIDGDIDVSAVGTTPGPGGKASGVSQQGGQGGAGGDGDSGVGSGGGGGAGGSFGAVATGGGIGANGNLGGVAGSAGTVGATYYPENNFENNFTGGSGGGTGGDGEDTVITEPGGTGGGGGGGLIIIAKGSVTINGNIIADGGAGDDGSDANGGQSGGGGGGGGSGGAIYLIGTTGVTINGTLNAREIVGGGGNGATGGGVLDAGGDGGDGSVGRIRIDTPTASRAGGGGIDPAPFESTLPTIIDPLTAGDTTLTSSLESSCSYKILDEFFWLYFLLGIIIGGLLILSLKGLHHLRYYLYGHNQDVH